MTNNDIRTALMSIRGKGIPSYEPKVNRRLGELNLKSEEQNVNEVQIGIVKWLKAKFPNLSKEQILDLINQKGGFVALTPAYLVTEIQKEIDKEEKEKLEAQAAVQKRENEEIANEQRQDEEHNDLFELTMNNGNFMLQDKDALLRDLQDRQRNVFDRNLKLLEALEAVRKISRQTDGMLQIDLSHMQNLDPKVFEMQKDLLSRFKVKAMTVVREGLERESPEREITIETVTKEQLEKGEVTFAIPFRELQSREWGERADGFRKQMEDYLAKKGIEVEKREPLRVEDDVVNAIAGNDRTIPANQRNIEDDEGR